MKYPGYIMSAVRQNLFHLDADDTSRDDKIAKLEPDDVFRSWLRWEGIYGYTANILEAIENIYNCDFDLRRFYEKENNYDC